MEPASRAFVLTVMVLSSEPNCYDGPLVCGSINARDPPVVSSESLESRDLTGGVMRQPRSRLLEIGQDVGVACALKFAMPVRRFLAT